MQIYMQSCYNHRYFRVQPRATLCRKQRWSDLNETVPDFPLHRDCKTVRVLLSARIRYRLDGPFVVPDTEDLFCGSTDWLLVILNTVASPAACPCRN